MKRSPPSSNGKVTAGLSHSAAVHGQADQDTTVISAGVNAGLVASETGWNTIDVVASPGWYDLELPSRLLSAKTAAPVDVAMPSAAAGAANIVAAASHTDATGQAKTPATDGSAAVSHAAFDTTAVPTAIPVAEFLNSIGINTHLDETSTSYADTGTVETELLYLGVGSVRDSMAAPGDSALFASVAAATGVKFDIYISQSAVSYTTQIADMLSNPAILRAVEGANESDTWTPAITYDGLTGYDATAALQQSLFEAASTLDNVGVIGPSYGNLADFSQASDTSAVSDYGNTHEYFGTGNPPGASLQALIADAQMASGSDPIIATEAGYYTGSSLSPGQTQDAQSGVDELVQAKYDLTLLFDDWAAGIQTTYLYELMDEAADPDNTDFQDHYGLFNADGTPKTAAIALHNLTSILSDSGATSRSDPFGYQITGLPSTGNSLLMEKSTGVFDLAVWNDVRLWSATSPVEIDNPGVPITINFGQLVQSVTEYDPIAGTAAVLTWSDVASIALDIVDHPVILEVSTYSAGPLSLSSFVLPETVAAGLWSGQSTANLWSTLVDNATESDPNLLASVAVSAVGTVGTAGGVTFDAANQTVIYQAPAYDPFDPTDGFTYTLSDADGDTVSGSVAVTETAPPATSYGTVAGAMVTAPSSAWTLVSEAFDETLQGSTLGGDEFLLDSDTTAYAAGAANTLLAGDGNHYVGAGGDGAVVTLGDGDNSIILAGTGNAVTAGTGNDLVYDALGGTTLTIGDGNQTITLGGAGNRISVGSGTSTINAGFDAGAGGEQVRVGGGSNTIAVAGAGDGVWVAGGSGNDIIATGGLATIEIDAGSNFVDAQGDGNAITALAGSNTIDAIGDGDTIFDGVGSDTLYVGGNDNCDTAGTGSDTITLVGTGNTVIGGAGDLILTDYGSDNTIVLGTAGSPVAELDGNLVVCDDVFDLRPLLAATDWDGSMADIGNYLSVGSDGPASIIAIDPDGSANRPATAVAVLENTDGLTLAALLAESLVPCYCAGTAILTVRGEVAVERLAVGDVVTTVSGAARPIRWIGRRSYDGRAIAGNRDVLPIRIAAGALADGVPARDLSVSPKHALFLDGVLIPAELLVNGRSIVQCAGATQVSYIHVELDSHDVLIAEGAAAESFTDCDNRAMFHNAHDYGRRYPSAPASAWQFCAPRVEAGEILETVRRRIAARAGLAPDGCVTAEGPLDGRIDLAHAGGLVGWAFDAGHPGVAVRLEILVNGAVVGETLANTYRDDLRQAAKGMGRCAFSFRFEPQLTADADHLVTARRASDGAVLGSGGVRVRSRSGAGLDGRVDVCTALAVAGWAVDAAAGDAPVALEILDDGRTIGRVLADRYRPDLDRAGRGSCAFLFRFDRASPPRDPRRIRVRHGHSGAYL